MLSKSYVASYIISGWKVSLENFHLGPAPAWLDNPPGDFHHVVGQYARFALTLSIRNNPSWSAIKVNAVHMYLGGSTIGINMRTNGNFAGDDVITLNLTVPFTELNELKYPCLYHYSKNMKKVPLTAVLVFVPTILGQDLGTFEMGTNSQLISISSTNILSTFIDEPVAKRCDVDLSEDSALLEGGLKTDLVEVRSLVYNLPY
ncbi:hypothetical protein FOL47_002298 [Perkinsus chesapeaki]|uniref:Uncharacterized protein n=1 Tax=Perkinsus chesapeaki TaxID=330153 RepID=A0A7J6MET0_PERCH|nr:hypothetical protein FOL47_002298 [Perkinsus chesapeaki]